MDSAAENERQAVESNNAFLKSDLEKKWDEHLQQMEVAGDLKNNGDGYKKNRKATKDLGIVKILIKAFSQSDILPKEAFIIEQHKEREVRKAKEFDEALFDQIQTVLRGVRNFVTMRACPKKGDEDGEKLKGALNQLEKTVHSFNALIE